MRFFAFLAAMLTASAVAGYRIGINEARRHIPLKGWANVYPDGGAPLLDVSLYGTREEADQMAGNKRIKCVHMKEVVE